MALTQENAAFVDCSAGTSKPWILAVRGIIRDDAGRWLLIRRSSQCEHFMGTWELPGGKADVGETVDASLRREVREETGLSVRPTTVAGVTECEMPKNHLVTVYFHTAAEAGTVTLSGEHDEFTWVPLREIHSLNLNSQIEDFLNCFRME